MPDLFEFLPQSERVNRSNRLLGDPSAAQSLGFDAFRQNLELLRGFTPNNRPQDLDSDFDSLGLFLDTVGGVQGGAGIDPTDARIHLADRNKLFTHPTSPNPFTGDREIFLDLIDAMATADRNKQLARRSESLRGIFKNTPLNQ
jgi:hypothetical protein